jgi:hypothetical protein
MGHEVIPMNEDQNAGHSYLEAKLVRLLVRRCHLPANSDQLPPLMLEIIAMESLVSSYRVGKGLEFKTAQPLPNQPKLDSVAGR